MDSAELGRRAEVAALRQCLGAAGTGAQAGLVVCAAAGLGKSALLAELAATAADVAVLHTRAVEFEADMPYAALQHLLAPRLPLLPTLPAPLRSALEVAFGSRLGKPDHFKAGLGAIALLTAVTPTLCLVDDAQYLDPSTAAALVLAARRLTHQNVAVIFAARSGHSVAALDQLPQLHLSPLNHVAARRLLSSTLPGRLDDRVRDQILSEARGVPAAITEVASYVRLASDLAGGYALPGAITPPARLNDEYERRLAGLSRAARTFVLLAAADPIGDPALLWRAADLAGIDGPSAADAIDAAALNIGLRVTFDHPLARSAVYVGAEPTDRRVVHELLAAASDPTTAADWHAWHRGQAVIAPDDDVSRALETAAVLARTHGGVSAEAAFIERGAALTADPRRRFQLILRAAAVTLDAGDVDAATDLGAAARLDAVDDTHSARVDVLLAQTAFARTLAAAEASQLIDAAADLARQNPRTAAPVHLQAMVAAYWTASHAAGPDNHERLSALAHQTVESENADIVDLVSPALAAALAGQRAAAVPMARRAVDALLARADQPDGFDPSWAWIVCSIAWDDETLGTILDEQLLAVRRAGRVGVLPVALTSRALGYLHEGDLAATAECVTEAQRLSTTIPAFVELAVAAWRGDRKTSDDLLLRLEGSADPLSPRQLAASTYARLLIHNGAGNFRRALSAAEAYSGHDELGFHAFIPPEIVEAAAHDGRLDVARALTERLGEHAEAAGTPWALGVHRRCQALVSMDSDAEEPFSASVEYLRRSRTPIQTARSQLLFGEWLRRRQRRNESREHLRGALETFSGVGATLFAKRAARELRAAGEVAPQPRGSIGELSAQELAVAERVADGKTSKEVAAELVLSPRTVDAHLRSIFSKLGVKSRREIRYALPVQKSADGDRPA